MHASIEHVTPKSIYESQLVCSRLISRDDSIYEWLGLQIYFVHVLLAQRDDSMMLMERELVVLQDEHFEWCDRHCTVHTVRSTCAALKTTCT